MWRTYARWGLMGLDGVLTLTLLTAIAWTVIGALRAPAEPTSGPDRVSLMLDQPEAEPVAPAIPDLPSEALPAPISASTPPASPAGAALIPAPVPEINETTTDGPLPKLGPQGQMAWQVYARPPVPADDRRPRIALVVADMGLIPADTQTAIDHLPPEVTLAFASIAGDADTRTHLAADARAKGHELLLAVPMEPRNFPTNDPGPGTLLTSLTDGENQARLRRNLGQLTGYVGITSLSGSVFTTSAERLSPILVTLKSRGLLFLDAQVSDHSAGGRLAKDMDLPHVISDRLIGRDLNRTTIDARLNELEHIAGQDGVAVGLVWPQPVVLERIANWSSHLAAKGIILVPISAAVGHQPGR